MAEAVSLGPRGFHGIRSHRLHTVGPVSVQAQGLGSLDTMGAQRVWGSLPLSTPSQKLDWAFPDQSLSPFQTIPELTPALGPSCENRTKLGCKLGRWDRTLRGWGLPE